MDPSGLLTGLGDIIVWGGIKTAEYAVKGISYLAGNPMSEEDFRKMNESLMGAWKGTTTVTPYVVGGATANITGSKAAGLWATWGAETTFGILAGDQSDKIGLPPFDIPGANIIDAIDIFNPTPCK